MTSARRPLARPLRAAAIFALGACATTSPGHARADIAAIDARLALRAAELEEASAAGDDARAWALAQQIQKLGEKRAQAVQPPVVTIESRIAKLEMQLKSLNLSLENLKRTGGSADTIAATMRSLDRTHRALASEREKKARRDQGIRAASLPGSAPASIPASRPRILIGP